MIASAPRLAPKHEESIANPDVACALLHKASSPEDSNVRILIDKARTLKGLSAAEAAVLLQVEDPALISEMFAAARTIKDEIYGKRIVLFAPLYYSNVCVNNCLYCGFRKDVKSPRRHLTQDEIRQETEALERQGHKRLLVIGGEIAGEKATDHLIEVIRTVYSTKVGRGSIRRVNVESAPMSTEDFRRLKAEAIGTYVLFQETYNPDTYRAMHPCGPKADYHYRLSAMDRALEAGIGDVGIGVLFGLHDYKEEVVSMLLHVRHLEQKFGTGPHTISVPRLEPAAGAPVSLNPPHEVSDFDFKKIVAILRMAVPYTGIILSTRENAALRAELLDLGVSQMSAGSRTEPGGYTESSESPAQFAVGDHRTLDEVIFDIAQHGYVPSFCTGCYRKGRTGQDFMDLAKPGLIKLHCLPNALLTFREYLLDYASEETRAIGEKLIAKQMQTEVPEKRREPLQRFLDRLECGDRDLYF